MRQSPLPVHLATLLFSLLRAALRPDDYDELIHAALSANEGRVGWGGGNLLRKLISDPTDELLIYSFNAFSQMMVIFF